MTLTYTNGTLKQKPSHNDHISYLDYYPTISNFHTMKMSRQEILQYPGKSLSIKRIYTAILFIKDVFAYVFYDWEISIIERKNLTY